MAKPTPAAQERHRLSRLAAGWDTLARHHRRARDLAGDAERRFHHDREVGVCLDYAARYRAEIAALDAAGGAA